MRHKNKVCAVILDPTLKQIYVSRLHPNGAISCRFYPHTAARALTLFDRCQRSGFLWSMDRSGITHFAYFDV